MLRKAAQTEGKDWDKLIPFLLFAYQEVPQASMYLWTSWKSWEAAKKDDDSVVSYVLSLWEKLQKMSQLACSNLQVAQSTHKDDIGQPERDLSS